MIASQIESPFADGYALLTIEPNTEKTFRKEKYNITYYHYVCQATGESVSTDESDELNVEQVYSEYRAKHRILSPEQISQMREQYGVSAARMSDILGFGPNQYRNYEDGEVPSLSNAKLLNLAAKPQNFRELVEEKKNELTRTQYEKLVKRLRELMDDGIEPIRIDGLVVCLASTISPAISDEYTGHSVPNAEKFAEMVLFFYGHLNHLYHVKLFKLLFYADFYHYKCTGHSISGYKYKAIKRGPVPENYSLHIEFMAQQRLLTQGVDPTHTRSDDGGPVTVYSASRKANMNMFSESEKEVLATVLKKLGYKKRPEIEQISHKEDGWIDNEQQRSLISYSKYAPTLKAI
jgi:putative zinc finger/helix-turn-helix YgiT family protein